MAEKSTGYIYTVSTLTREIKTLLEETYPFIWVCGEISNYSVPASGHSYFTLKDQQATIQAVMFKNQKLKLRFDLEGGMKVYGLARLSIYEPRGTYQLIFEHLEPEGTGSFQIAFEQLKRKLSDKGYFDQKFKKPIPSLPLNICIITSGTGAALRDIIHISKRRFSNCRLEILPVKVQGEGADIEIINAIYLANQRQRAEIIILARGGGSLEDLSAFNSESVAEAIFQSKIPIISGIGHETDFTIADFVADLRAPTPSAAAELALPDKRTLMQRVFELRQRMDQSIFSLISNLHHKQNSLISRLKSPEMVIYTHRLKLEDLEFRLNHQIKASFKYHKEKIRWLSDSLYSKTIKKRISDQQQYVKMLCDTLTHHFYVLFQKNKTKLIELASKLDVLSPLSVLNRGYSISRFVLNKNIITDSAQVKLEDKVETILLKGRLISTVEKIDG
ncbi:MAG: exodeoxyribonuclease VII large subunit [Desulfobacteraceae bacterium]|nr:exodeoxyribonuclease VII large subunit [Desulfobacteraceae bacterium]